MQRTDVRRKDQWSDWCEMFWFLWFLKIFLLSYILMRKRQCDIINLQLVSIIFMCLLFMYEHLVCNNKTSNSFFFIGTPVSSSNISAQAHFIFHQTIIQSQLCLQLSPSCQRRRHDSSGINGRSLLPGPGVERPRPMKERSCDYR